MYLYRHKYIYIVRRYTCSLNKKPGNCQSYKKYLESFPGLVVKRFRMLSKQNNTFDSLYIQTNKHILRRCGLNENLEIVNH